jgi:plasmid stabilization system protein ParE
MAKRKIVWSHKARIKLFEILDFYHQRNKNKTYSRKLYQEFQKNINLLRKQPTLGIKTDQETVRALIIGDFIVFYEYNSIEVVILTLWDCRQNPNSLEIK